MLRLLTLLFLLICVSSSASASGTAVFLGRISSANGQCTQESARVWTCKGAFRTQSMTLVVLSDPQFAFSESPSGPTATWTTRTTLSTSGTSWSEEGVISFPDKASSTLSYSGNGTAFVSSPSVTVDAFLGAINMGTGAFAGAKGTIVYSEVSPLDFKTFEMNFVITLGMAAAATAVAAPKSKKASTASAGPAPMTTSMIRFHGSCNSTATSYSCFSRARLQHSSLLIPETGVPSFSMHEAPSGGEVTLTVKGTADADGNCQETGVIDFGSGCSFTYTSDLCDPVGMAGNITAGTGVFQGAQGRAGGLVVNIDTSGNVEQFVTTSLL